MAPIATVLADTAQLAHEQGQLPDALDELAVRCDLIGAGDLVDQWAHKRVNRRRRARRRWYQRNRPT
jgi:hypothetical protein